MSSRFRTQGANRQDVLHRPRKRKKTKPSKAAKQRRSQTKAARGRVRGDD